MKNREILIGQRSVGKDFPPYFIAELSANHNGKLENALAIMEKASEAGADAVKLQTYTADTMTIDHKGPGFEISGGLWDGRRLYDLYQEAHMPWDWHGALFRRGRELGISVFSTPFDESAVEFLETFDPPAYKIASFELLDLPLIRRAAQTGKPLIISTGMAVMGEIGEALEAAQSSGGGGVILLHCTSGYPTPHTESNLKTLQKLEREFGVIVGLSDHTLERSVPIAAVSLGAAVIEKHFTLQRADGGPDAEFSIEPHELKEVTYACKTAWEAVGSIRETPTASEAPNLQFRRSLYVVEDIPVGTRLTRKNVRAIRPGFGLSPKFIDDVLGCIATQNLSRGTPLDWPLINQKDEA
jgi:pseudaminic acid synthase